MRIMITVSYDGTNYCGWQRQSNGVSVQETIERAVFLLTGEKVTVTGSGRTDAGVHAQVQVAHFDTQCTVPPEKIYLALNAHLPDDVKITSSRPADKDFHSRFSAKRKTYTYSFYYSDVTLPLKDRYACRLDDGELDFTKMTLAANAICGEHDFKAFSSTGSTVKDTVRTIYDVTFSKKDDGFFISICGNGFLYNMVRVICGALISVGKGEINVTDLKTALLTGKRSRFFKTLPAKGLTLQSVEYE